MDQAQMLPPEYQQYLANLEQRKQIAAAAMMRAREGIASPMQYTPGPFAQAVPANPLALALYAYTARKNRKALEGADKEKQDFLSGYSAGERGELEQLNAAAADPKGDLARFLAHPMPRVAAQAAAERNRRLEEAEKVRQKAAEVTAKRDPQAAIGILTGQVAPDGYQFPPLQQPRVEPINVGGVDYVQVTNFGEDNVPRATITAPPSRVEVNTGDRDEGKAITALNAEDLKNLLTSARNAQQTLGNVARIADEFEKGAQAGFGQTWILTAQKFGNLLGAKFDTTAPTETVKTALMEGVLGKASALRPVSNDEVKFLQQMVGSIDTDPKALANLLAWYNAQALWEIQNFQKQREAMAAAAPNLRDRYATVGAGVELPKDLRVPPWMKFKSFELLQMMGGDEALAPFGFEPGARFNIQGPRTGLIKPQTAPVKDRSTEDLINELTGGGRK